VYYFFLFCSLFKSLFKSPELCGDIVILLWIGRLRAINGRGGGPAFCCLLRDAQVPKTTRPTHSLTAGLPRKRKPPGHLPVRPVARLNKPQPLRGSQAALRSLYSATASARPTASSATTVGLRYSLIGSRDSTRMPRW